MYDNLFFSMVRIALVPVSKENSTEVSEKLTLKEFEAYELGDYFVESLYEGSRSYESKDRDFFIKACQESIIEELDVDGIDIQLLKTHQMYALPYFEEDLFQMEPVLLSEMIDSFIEDKREVFDISTWTWNDLSADFDEISQKVYLHIAHRYSIREGKLLVVNSDNQLITDWESIMIAITDIYEDNDNCPDSRWRYQVASGREGGPLMMEAFGNARIEMSEFWQEKFHNEDDKKLALEVLKPFLISPNEEIKALVDSTMKVRFDNVRAMDANKTLVTLGFMWHIL